MCCGSLSISQKLKGKLFLILVFDTNVKYLFDICIFCAVNLWKDAICICIEVLNAEKLRNNFNLIMITEMSFEHHCF